jgi:hypothetical protein
MVYEKLLTEIIPGKELSKDAAGVKSCSISYPSHFRPLATSVFSVGIRIFSIFGKH